jgi:hypothetical protein
LFHFTLGMWISVFCYCASERSEGRPPLQTNQIRFCADVSDGGESSSNKLRDVTTPFGQCRGVSPTGFARAAWNSLAAHASNLHE